MRVPFVPASLRFTAQTALLMTLLGVFPLWYTSSRTPHAFSVVLVQEESDRLEPYSPALSAEDMRRLTQPLDLVSCGGVDLDTYGRRKERERQNLATSLAFLLGTIGTAVWVIRQRRSTKRAQEGLFKKFL